MIETILLPLLDKDFLKDITVGIAMFIIVIVLFIMLINERRKRDKESLDRAQIQKDGFAQLAASFTAGIDKLDKSFSATFREHEKLEMKEIKDVKRIQTKGFRDMKMAHGNTVLNEQQAVDMLLEKMWIASRQKIDFIGQILRRNHIKERKTEIKRNIKAELERISTDTYMKDFGDFIVPVGNGNLREWVDKHFNSDDFKEFLEKIYEVVFKEYSDDMDKEAVIALKCNDIGAIMKHLHNNLGSKLRACIEDDK